MSTLIKGCQHKFTQAPPQSTSRVSIVPEEASVQIPPTSSIRTSGFLYTRKQLKAQNQLPEIRKASISNTIQSTQTNKMANSLQMHNIKKSLTNQGIYLRTR